MNLPFFKKNSDSEKNYFLSLLIKPYKIGAILFEELDDNLVILASYEVATEKDADDLSIEELLKASDRAISSIEPSLPEGAGVEKTIFSVPATWVNEGKISPENLSKLKKLCDDLGLVPMGYLMSIEAIVHFLQRKEGAPISAIFVEAAGEKAFVYLVKGGKIIEFKESDVVEDILAAVENSLREFETDVLPSKIILLDHKKSTETQQQFLSHTWPEDIAFLHLPQVITLEPGLENEATINGVASQMDLKVAHGSESISEAKGDSEALDDVEVSEDFGFLREKDIAEESEEVEAESKVDSSEVLETDENIRVIDDEDTLSFKREEEDADEEPSISEPEQTKTSPIALILGIVKKIKIPKVSAGKFLTGGGIRLKLIAGLIIAIVVAVLFSYIYYNYILRVDITVFAEQIVIEDAFDAQFSASGGEGSIPIELIEQEVQGEESRSSTGIVETGENATGAISIFNKTETPRTFDAGTVIIGPNDLEFILQEDVTVASTSAFSTELSNAEGDVEAADFGTEYNLPSESNFTIEGFASDLYIGKNSTAITGGTREENTVVAEADLDALEESIVGELEKEALSNARSKLSDGENLLSRAVASDLTESEFSAAAGDEEGSISITATLVYSIGKYRSEDLSDFIVSSAEVEIPDGYVFSEGNSSIDIAELEIDDEENISATLDVNAIYVPQIEGKEFAESIKGKSQSFAEEEIGGVNGITDVIINFRNSLPILPKIIPYNVKNISIEFKS